MSLAGSAARVAAFLLCFAILQLGWQSLREGPLRQPVVQDALLRPAAAILNLFSPDLGVTVQGATIRATTGGALHIVNGCEGVEAQFLFLSALSVAPRRRFRLWKCLLAGMLVLQGVNILRVAGLFAAFHRDPAWFVQLHATVFPLFTVFVATACLLGCLPRSEPRHATG